MENEKSLVNKRSEKKIINKEIILLGAIILLIILIDHVLKIVITRSKW